MNERFKFDEKYLKSYQYVIGTDEAGRGPGAGPVYAAAVCFAKLEKDLKKELEELNDSKKLTPKKREELYEIITQNSIWAVSAGSIEEIEKLNILKASLLSMKRSIESVKKKLDSNSIIVLVDGNKKIDNIENNQEAIVKGDMKSASIAAASIIAKVTRDRFMMELDKEYPVYCWGKNKGYMTKLHLESVEKYGLTKWHRKKFFESYINNRT